MNTAAFEEKARQFLMADKAQTLENRCSRWQTPLFAIESMASPKTTVEMTNVDS